MTGSSIVRAGGQIHQMTVGRTAGLPRTDRPDATRRPPVAGVNLWLRCVLIATAGCGGLTHDSPRTIETIERHGGVEVWNGRVTAVRLRDRPGVDAVVPLLPRLPKLNSLHIAGVALSEEHLKIIGQLDLTALRLGQCNVDDEDLRFLARLTSLKRLSLIHNPITDEGLKHLSSMGSITEVDLSWTNIRGAGLRFLPTEAPLGILMASNTKLEDSALIFCARFEKLRRFDFSYTNITKNGLDKLVDLHWLNTIECAKTGIKRADMLSFRKAHTCSKERARAKGIAVPPKWQGPFGAAVLREDSESENQ